jgi:hypothetical protein
MPAPGPVCTGPGAGCSLKIAHSQIGQNSGTRGAGWRGLRSAPSGGGGGVALGGAAPSSLLPDHSPPTAAWDGADCGPR